jgi:integrase
MGKPLRSGALHRLSVREVVNARAGDHHDGGGLLLRIRDDDAGVPAQVSFVFRYTAVTGKRREMGVGRCERHNVQAAGASLTRARDAAAASRAMLAEIPPRDPISERDRAKEEIRRALVLADADRAQSRQTVARVARAYHERVIESKRSAKHGREWITSLERLVPAVIWHAPVAEVTGPALLDALTDLYTRVPVTASRVRQRLEAVLAEAMFRGLCTSNPAAAIRRKVAEARVKAPVSSHRALPYVDVPDFVRALRAQPGIAARALEFALLTAARTSEVIGATWAEIDETAAVWTVPATRMKGGEEHRVPLTDRALEIVTEMRETGGLYVFPNPRKLRLPLSNMAFLMLLDRMAWRSRTTAHGLCRSTFSTWANELSIARPDVIEACLAHREGDRIRAAYNRAQFNSERRALLDRWARFVDEHTVVKNVVSLHAA